MTGTDEQIQDGFARLTSALAPPADAPERVARRITQRRRLRRAGVAVCGVVVIAAAGTAVVIGGDGGDGPGTVAADPAGPDGSLVLTRPDGSTYPFGGITVQCGPGPTGQNTGTPTIVAQSARRMDGSRLLRPWFYFEGKVGDLELGRTYELPMQGGSDEVPLVVFVADVAGDGQDGNEVSSSEPGAAGTVRVLRASCEPAPSLEVEIDATLGSEVEQEPFHVAGTLD